MGAGLGDRCTAVGGSFLDGVPEGGDVYVFSAVLCDWGDEQAVSILRNAREAMPEHGRVLMVESLVPDGAEPHMSKVNDVYLFVAEGGGVRTRTEWRRLLERAGFVLARVVPSESWSLLEARPSAVG